MNHRDIFVLGSFFSPNSNQLEIFFKNWSDFRPPELVFAPINLQKVPHFFSFDYLDVGLVYFYSHVAHEVAVLGWMIDSELEIEQVGPFQMVSLDQISKHWRNSPLNYYFQYFCCGNNLKRTFFNCIDLIAMLCHNMFLDEFGSFELLSRKRTEILFCC